MIYIAKIKNDKYYTPKELAKYCIDKTYEIIGEENISEVIEPSAGNGSFSLQIPSVCWAYDIDPEQERIIQKDFLELNITYLWGRLIIGNPPFGTRNTMAVKFYKKAIELGDYVAFILPISQYKNTQQMYEFDLLYSEDLGIKEYSEIPLHCCFNIYRRPSCGELNKKPNYDLKDVEVIEFRRGGKAIAPKEYDFGMCTWGNGSCGKQVQYQGQYAQEHYIIVKNPIFKEKIIKVCNETDWRHLYPSVSSAKLQTWKIYKHLKEQIPELE
ncbi:hypothetical protein [Clostridium sporogenes]|uniref:hypothetical protein n=1 Tax=Clostridium sporogenes TaxID=1509 RepID=UPI0013CFE759|nr:hypothetical protein [Clostridium sporogenes]NFH40836.1 hypothetical protein [Clostridium sporogenes]